MLTDFFECFFFGFNVLVKMFPEKFYPQMIEQMAGIGLSQSILPVIATLELLCTILFLIPRTSVLGGLIWLGIYLREPRLRSLLPLRKER